MNVSIQWQGDMRFEGASPNNQTVHMDGNAEAGTSPMTLLLHAQAGCAGIDVVAILKKQRQSLESLDMEVEAVRAGGDYPRVWEKIHLRFIIGGDVARDKAEKAVALSLEKYCSVSAMLKKTAEVTSEVILK
ncbi:MAG: OsmC family protein [Bacteroidota bacterium]